MSQVPEIKARLNIVDVVSDYVSLTKSGVNWKGRCPFHQEKSPSFMVHEEKQIWRCFGCDRGGDLISFVEEIEGISFIEALKILAEKAGVELEFKKDTPRAGHTDRLIELLELSSKFWEKQLWDGAGKKHVLDYLYQRGFGDQVLKTFRIGYAPEGWRHLLEFLSTRGFTPREIEQSGLVIRKQEREVSSQSNGGYYDRFRDRIIFPVFDARGRVVGFSGRVGPGATEEGAKYINTPETDVYHKSQVLYGYYHSKDGMRSEKSVIVVEGNADVLAMYQAGYTNTVAVSGTALTNEQITLLKRFVSSVVLFFDMDSAGQLAARRSAQMCFSHELDVKLVQLSHGKDAADLLRDNPNELQEAVQSSRGAMDVFFEQAFLGVSHNDPQGKRRGAEELFDLLASFKNEIERAHWFSKVSLRVGLREDQLKEMVSRRRPQLGESRIEDTASQLQPVLKKEKSRSDVVRDEIVARLLTNKDLWAKMVSDPTLRDQVQSDSLLETLLAHGESSGFDPVVLLTQDVLFREEIKNLYKLGIDRSFDEDSISSLEIFSDLLSEFGKEQRKERIQTLVLDIQKAEDSGDHEALSLLNQEFIKLHQEKDAL